jgi:hypothetical protein
VNEPIFFYIHPGDGRVGVLKHLFDRIVGKKIRKMTFGEFVDEWCRRREILGRIDLSLDEDAVICRSGGDDRDGDDRFPVSITDPKGRWSLARTDGRTEWKDLEWRSEPEPPTGVADAGSLLGERRRRILEDIRTYFWRRRG